MRDTIDVEDAIFVILNANVPLKNLISGGIYNGARPDGSSLEDITVNSPFLADGSVQEGYANVNIHVDDIQITELLKNGVNTTRSVVNKNRIKIITNAVKPLLQEYYGNDFNLFITNTGVIRDSETTQHYMNIRLRVRLDDMN